jgi:hypothetical protein
MTVRELLSAADERVGSGEDDGVRVEAESDVSASRHERVAGAAWDAERGRGSGVAVGAAAPRLRVMRVEADGPVPEDFLKKEVTFWLPFASSALNFADLTIVVDRVQESDASTDACGSPLHSLHLVSHSDDDLQLVHLRQASLPIPQIFLKLTETIR